jgi:NADH-quinone oxidoreductase subunit C
MSAVVLEKLAARFPEAVLETHAFRGDETAVVEARALREICLFLKSDPGLGFDMLSDATAVDYLGTPGRGERARFEVVYHLYSTQHRLRLRLKVLVPEEQPEVDSLCELYAIANWLEREIWDMYGIRFRGHPELRRILLYEEFVGHPLRKDYPKEKRQPLVRRPEPEIAEVLARRGRARPILDLASPGSKPEGR